MPLGRGVYLPLAEVEVRTSRSSGPGGQHANVTASRVEASFDLEASDAFDDAQRARVLARLGPRPSAVSQDSRSQARNRETALERLRDRVSEALEVPRPRRATRPSRSAKERRLEQKRQAGQRKAERRPPSAED